MLHDGLALALLDHLHREQIGEDRKRLVEHAALVVAVGEPDRIQHGPKLTMQGEAMKLCQYDEHQAGAVRGDRMFTIGTALVAAGHLRRGYTMQEVIEALANRPDAMQCAREALGEKKSFPRGSVTLLAPIENPPSIWAAAANYKAHAAEMLAASGGPDRSRLGKDDLMAEFFLKPSSSIIGPGGSIILPKISMDVRIEVELNGRPAMTAHTSDMICGLRDHIRFLSNVLTLRSGDLITTGTPAGVAKLAPGDKLRGRIECIGEMSLNVESEAL